MATPVQIAVWVAKAGWPDAGTAAPEAVAVALGYSGGNQDKAGGLWGLPGAPGAPGGDGTAQAQHAAKVYAQSGWGPFPGHRNNAYLLFMPAGVAAVGAAGAQLAAQNPGEVLNALGDAAQALPGADMLDVARTGLGLATKAGAWLGNQDNWARIAEVLVGGILVSAGIVALAAKPAIKAGEAAMKVL